MEYTLFAPVPTIPALLVLILMLWTAWSWYGPNNLRQIPTMGSSIPIVSYMQGLSFVFRAKKKILAGYAKYGRTFGIFKVAMSDQWLVMVSSHKLLEELKRFTDDEISNYGGLDELLCATYSIGSETVSNPYFLSVIQNKLNRNLGDFHGVLKEELWSAFDSSIGSPSEWTKVPAYETMLSIISRTGNRVIVGLPLCRDPEFVKLTTEYTMSFSQTRFILRLFHPLLKPLVSKLVNTVPSKVKKMVRFVGPMIEERRRLAQEYQNTKESWEDKPNDLLMWLLDEGLKHGFTIEGAVLYLMNIEFISMHSTTISFTQALFYIAADPSLAIPLRAEVESVLDEENGDLGTRTAVSKLKKMDSFLREAQRLNGPNTTSIWRKTLKPITFSNGITVPPGVFISAPATAIHQDEENFADPDTFNPWRFVDSDSSRSFTSISTDYVVFGQGKHACPGRHFAAYEMKLMLAYIVMNYDIKLEPEREGIVPENIWIGSTIIPDSRVNILVRKRSDAERASM